MEFSKALTANMGDFGLEINEDVRLQLTAYYDLLLRWNDRLHLVAPCSPEEFAIRHVLESVFLTHQLPSNATIADIGSGAGLPIIPCMIFRPDLETTLIESSQKKSVFLREAINQLRLKRGTIICKPFEDTPAPDVAFVSSRALDDFLAKIRTLVKWSPGNATLLLFGGTGLHEELEKLPCQFSEILIPQSTQRFLFVVKKHGLGPSST